MAWGGLLWWFCGLGIVGEEAKCIMFVVFFPLQQDQPLMEIKGPTQLQAQVGWRPVQNAPTGIVL